MVCHITKAKLFQEAMFFVIVLLTSSKYTGPKWPLSTWKASFMHLRQGISLLSTYSMAISNLYIYFRLK